MVHLFNCAGWLPNRWNAGHCHARGFGLAKSFTKNLDKDTLIDHDEDAVAAVYILGTSTSLYAI